MDLLKFDAELCTLCNKCIQKCPFGALNMGEKGIEVNEKCRMCGVCVKVCPQRAIRFEQKARSQNKQDWNGFLIFAEQERGKIHPVAFELIGEARKMAEKVGFDVDCLIIGGKGTRENARLLLDYGVQHVFVFEDPCFEGFRQIFILMRRQNVFPGRSLHLYLSGLQLWDAAWLPVLPPDSIPGLLQTVRLWISGKTQI